MRPGQRTSSSPGDIQDQILDVEFRPLSVGGAANIWWLPADGYGDKYYGTYLNGVKVAHTYVEEGKAGDISVPLADVDASASVHIEDMGDWADPSYDFPYNALDQESASSTQISATWKAKPEVEERIDANTSFSSWVLTGLKRFTNIAKVPGRSTQGLLYATMTNSGSVRTVGIYNGNRLVASGYRTGDGSVTLTEENSSGVSGTVTVAFTSTVALGDVPLTVRWPASYQVHYTTSSLSFPRTPERTVLDNGQGNFFGFTTGSLDDGTYNVAIVPVSDTGKTQTETTSLGHVIVAPPLAPLRVVYLDGNSTNTRLRFTAASATSTYKIYCPSAVDQPINMSTAAVTEAAAAGVHTISLPSFGASVTGKVRVLVRAVSASGIEEKNGQVIVIEYLAGVRVVNAPTIPRIDAVAVTSGRTVTVEAVYDPSGSDAMAVGLELFLWAYALGPGGATYSSPVATASFGDAVRGKIRTSVSYAHNADGHFFVGVRAVTLGGVDDGNEESQIVFLSNAVVNTVDDLTVRVARG